MEKSRLLRFISEIKQALKPGLTPFLILIARLSIVLVLLFSIFMTYFFYNVHYLVLSFISTGLFLSFEYSMMIIKRNPKILEKNVNKKDE